MFPVHPTVLDLYVLRTDLGLICHMQQCIQYEMQYIK